MNRDIANAYAKASKRLFLLDYDGTLAPLMPTPPEAKPAPVLLKLLEQLTRDPANTVVIISGRDHPTLDEWLGRLPVAFAAEHGLLFKDRGQNWQPASNSDDSWKPQIRSLMEPYASQVKGALIEEKTNALVWHYRAAADPEKAQRATKELTPKLLEQAKLLKLRVMPGSHIVEVQPLGIHKGIAAERWLSQGGWDFIFAAGDDTTDEDLFAALPKDAYSVKVGKGPSRAILRVANPQDIYQLLNSIITYTNSTQSMV